MHQRVVVVTTAGEQLVREITVQTFVVMNSATAKVVKSHCESDQHQTGVYRPLDAERYFQAACRIGYIPAGPLDLAFIGSAFSCVSRGPKPPNPPTGEGLDLFCWCVICRQMLSIDTEHGVPTALDNSVTNRIEHCHVDVAVG